MVCKFEMIAEDENYGVRYTCDQFGFSNVSICTKLTQPNCYEEEN